MELRLTLTTRQLEILRAARDREAPDLTLEEYVVRAFVAETRRAGPAGGEGR